MGLEGMVNWSSLGQEDYDRAVEVLIRQIYKIDRPSCQVKAYDGRGGDGGRDVEVYDELGVLETLYQLKFYPEGFSGGFKKTRRDQISGSYKSATELKPPPKYWVLVVPRNPTPAEDAWVASLPKTGQPPTSIMARAELDGELSRFPLLLQALTRVPMQEALRSLNLERLTLDTPENLRAVSADLQSRLAARSVHWGQRVIVDRGMTTHEVYPLHPDAMTAEPISVDLKLSSDADSALKEKIARFEEYGGPAVEIPAQVVDRVMTTGPAWLREERKHVRVRLGSSRSSDVVAEIRAVSAAGTTVSSLFGVIAAFTPGSRGVTLAGEFVGKLKMSLRIPKDVGPDEAKAQGDFSYDVSGASATDAARVLHFVARAREGSMIEVWSGGVRQWAMKSDQPEAFPVPDRDLSDLVADLRIIENALNVTLPVPSSFGAHDRAEIRRCSQLLSGACILEPAFSSFQFVLDGSTDSEFEDALLKSPFALKVSTRLIYDIGGLSVELPECAVFHTALEVVDAAGVVEALRQGRAEGLEVRTKSMDGTPMRAFVPELQADSNARLIPIPLGLPGISEHPSQGRFNS